MEAAVFYESETTWRHVLEDRSDNFVVLLWQIDDWHLKQFILFMEPDARGIVLNDRRGRFSLLVKLTVSHAVANVWVSQVNSWRTEGQLYIYLCLYCPCNPNWVMSIWKQGWKLYGTHWLLLLCHQLDRTLSAVQTDQLSEHKSLLRSTKLTCNLNGRENLTDLGDGKAWCHFNRTHGRKWFCCDCFIADYCPN